MKQQDADHDVIVIEQNPRGATWGFGVVFSGTALAHVETADQAIFDSLIARAEVWEDLTIAREDDKVPIDGNRFAAISRLALLDGLIALCESAGVTLEFDTRLDDLDGLADADLIVGADGVNSLLRDSHAQEFGTRTSYLTNAFVWYGTSRPFDSLTLTFRANGDGHFVAHHYRYQPDMSTFIVECDAATFDHAGFEHMDDAASRAYCEQVFANDLEGHDLISNKSVWRRFPVITNDNWTCGNMVLIGDALRTAHFSIGSGTRLAMEDAAVLAEALERTGGDVRAGFGEFERVRRPQVETIAKAAAGSYNWYEEFADRFSMTALELAYDYMTRSGRVDDARLRRIAPKFMSAYDARS
jgi:2-polyprenyl-6-methoxyphenol hydroxylase-like FAD-dependent oxidoreductase